MTQASDKGYKMIKLRAEIVDVLDKEKELMIQNQPFLKGLLSYNAVVQMLLSCERIRLSKKRWLVVKKD